MVELLVEMLREAERTIDHQLRTLEELDDKSEQLLTLGLATLGGGAALAAFAVDKFPLEVSSTVKVWIGCAFLVNMSALVAFLDPYVGLSRRVDTNVGPSLVWLARKANDATWEPEQHYVSIVHSYQDYFQQNSMLIARHRAKNRWGLLLLLAAVVGFATATFYVAW